ncbi:MAG: LytR C-terminal domain-containing protein [Burkholderiaceae bacterium]|nr:LytR C-terminal domain-containing protein [Burkholderiaceae bacterium]
MRARIVSTSFTFCAVASITGCATAPGPVQLNARNTQLAPLYRVEQPAGTAVGQFAAGRLHLAEGRVDAAIERFRSALALEPGYVDALNSLGIAFGLEGRHEEAIEAFRTALASAPESARLLNNLGYAQFEAGRLQEATESLERALQLDPGHARARTNLRWLIESRDRASKSERPPSAPTPRAPAPLDPASMQALERFRRAAAVVPVHAPRVESRESGVEIVRSNSGDTMLVPVAPAVYELRVAPAARQPLPAAAPGKAESEPERPSLQPASLAIDRIEVSNGAGTARLATRTAQRLGEMGARVSRVTNHSSFEQRYTEIHYRDGHADEAARLGKRLPVAARLVAVAGLRADVDIRLVVGRDIAGADVAAWWNSPAVAAVAATAKAPDGG